MRVAGEDLTGWLKYHNSINDAVADLGDDIGQAFTGFQKYLYQGVAQSAEPARGLHLPEVEVRIFAHRGGETSL